MIYTTQSIKNLFDGTPFTLEVPDKTFARFEKAMGYARSGAPMTHTTEDFMRLWEFTFFPSYQELLKIWFENGYTDELMAKILKDFGIPDDFAQKLLEDEKFIGELRGWFEGITCDGERAVTTLSLVYDAVAGHFSVKEHSSTWIV